MSFDELQNLISLDTSSLFDGSTDTPVPYLDAKLELRKLYDKAHNFNTGPYGIAMCVGENPCAFSLYAYWRDVFIKERIHKHYGLTIDQFLARPRYKIELLLEGVKDINTDESKQSDLMSKTMQNMATEAERAAIKK